MVLLSLCFHSGYHLVQLYILRPTSVSATPKGPSGVREVFAHPSIPHVTLVDLDPVALANPPELVLKRHGSMMFLLVGNVCLQLSDMAGTDREGPVAILPIKAGPVGRLGFDPL